MKTLATRPICWGILVPSLIMTFVFACAAFPPAEPAKDLKSIAGKWEGFGTRLSIDRMNIKLTVREDGKWEMIVDPRYLTLGRNFFGIATVDEGKIELHTDTPGLSGVCTLHSRGDGRWMVFKSNDGTTTADLKRSF